MGVITINIAAEVIDGEPNDGQITSTVSLDEPCENKWLVKAKTNTSAWVEFTIPGTCVINQITPAGPFVNGIAITGTFIWEFEIVGYVSPTASQNTILSTVVARIYDSEGGTLLDTSTVNHYHTNLFC